MLARAAFRFCLLYFVLYSFATQIAGGLFLLPGLQVPAFGALWPMRPITEWLAVHVAGATLPLNVIGTSGDTLFHWVQMAWLLIVAAVGAALWCASDRGRRDDATMAAWFRLFLRFALAAQMFYYGMAKVIPTQFQAPSLVTLVEPVGNLSLSDLLWTFIGASTPYQMVTGWAEVVAGILLVIPHTATLGALICAADMLQVFLLNMTYDFGLKQISLHLLLMAIFLVVPELPGLANLLVRNRPTTSVPRSVLFRAERGNRIALVAQIVLGTYLAITFAQLSLRLYYTQGDGRPRSPLYGIWDVIELSIDGQQRAPQENEYDYRWRRVIFDAPDTVVFQRTDDSFAHYGVQLDRGGRTFSMSKADSGTWEAAFEVQRSADDRLAFTGHMDGHAVRVRLQRLELDTFRLLNSRFRWIRPPDPFAG